MNGFNHQDLTDIAVKGVFCVKLPANVRSTGAWKVWSPKLLIIRPQNKEISNQIHKNKLILTIFKSSRVKDITSQGFVIQEILNPSRTIIFRCKSRKKPHAFTIYGDGKPLVHISGDSETESQLLIKSVRNSLWPPNPILSLSKTLGSVFEVSIIDNEMSYRAGLLGVCGYLTITSEKVTLTCPQTGHIIQEWLLSTLSFRLVPQYNLKDNNKVINMSTNENSGNDRANILIYCENASEMIIQVNRVRPTVNLPIGPSSTAYSDELFEHLNVFTAEYDLMSRFDDLDGLVGETKINNDTSDGKMVSSPSRSISDCSSITTITTSPRISFDQLESSLDLSSSLSTNISSLLLDVSVHYDVPRPLNSLIDQSSTGYATIKKSSTNQQSILNKISNLSSSVLDCSLNINQRCKSSDYPSLTNNDLATSLPSAVEHIYEEIGSRDNFKCNSDDYNDDIYELIEPLRKLIFQDMENVKPDDTINGEQLTDKKAIEPNDIVDRIERPKSVSNFSKNEKTNDQQYKANKGSPKGVSRFSYFRLRRTLSESWFNTNQSVSKSP